jgi:methylmalonyl-CoA/ethylmalonyl-CoA epimerase
MIIDHIGIVVKSIEKGIEQWHKSFGYQQMTEPVLNTRQKVMVVFLSKESSISIKLIQPSDQDSPVYKFAYKGGGLHHICFRCENIDTEIKRLKDEKFRMLTLPEPGEAFENERIAFLFGAQGLNIELIETEKRAKIIL